MQVNFNTRSSQSFQGIRKISVEDGKKYLEGVKGAKFENEPMTIDPLTGEMITVSESNAKYGDGSKLIYVKIEGEVTVDKDGTEHKGMGKIERITIAEYQKRYTNYTNPPKAAENINEFFGDTSNVKPATNDEIHTRIDAFLNLYDSTYSSKK